MTTLKYEVVACSNDSSNHPVENINRENDFYESNYLDEKWNRHEKVVDIVIRFMGRVELQKMKILSLQGGSIQISVGNGEGGSFIETRWKEVGGDKKIRNDREVTCDYLRIRLDRKQDDSYIRIGQVICIGERREQVDREGEEGGEGEEEEENKERQLKVEQILVELGMPVDYIEQNYMGYVDEYGQVGLDSQTLSTLQQVRLKHTRVKNNHDYQALVIIQQDMKALVDIGRNILKVERELQWAIEKEDFNQAMILKEVLKKYKGEREQYDIKYETSMYIDMIQMRDDDQWDQQQKRNMDQLKNVISQKEQRERIRIQQEQQERDTIHRKERERLEREERERMEKEGKEQKKAWWEEQQNRELEIKEKKNKNSSRVVVEQKEYTNIFNYNEGDKRMEDYFNENIKVEIEMERLRNYHSMGILQILGARVWSAVHSPDWRIREQAIQSVLSYITNLIQTNKLIPQSRKLFQACIEVSKLGCDDKILQVYFLGLKVLVQLLNPPICGDDISIVQINKEIQPFLGILLNKISELNNRARDISQATLVGLFHHPSLSVSLLVEEIMKVAKCNEQFSQLFVPINKQQPRIILSRLEVFLQILQEKGLEDGEDWDHMEVFELLVIKSLGHSNGNVRVIAMELVKLYFGFMGEPIRELIQQQTHLKAQLKEQLLNIMTKIDKIGDHQLSVVQESYNESNRNTLYRDNQDDQYNQEIKNNSYIKLAENNSLIKMNKTQK